MIKDGKVFIKIGESEWGILVREMLCNLRQDNLFANAEIGLGCQKQEALEQPFFCAGLVSILFPRLKLFPTLVLCCPFQQKRKKYRVGCLVPPANCAK